MNKIQTKLFRCLSDPELTDSEFNQLLELLFRGGFKELVPLADHFRRLSRDSIKGISISGVSEELLKHVEATLFRWGKMGPSSAVQLLLSELRDEPVPPRRWTTRAGLEYALTFASESDIVAAARRVAAKYSPSIKGHAWSLEKKGG